MIWRKVVKLIDWHCIKKYKCWNNKHQDYTWKKLSIKDTEQPSNNADSLDKVLIKIDKNLETLLQIWKQVFVASDSHNVSHKVTREW